MKASIRWTGNVQFTGTPGSGHSIVIDGPPELGGRDQGVRPMELMLLGVGSCTSFDVVNILRRGRQDVVDCVTQIEAQRADTEPKVFTRIHLHFRISGRGIDRRKVERAIELTAGKYCSASIMLERAGVAVSHDYEITEA